MRRLPTTRPSRIQSRACSTRFKPERSAAEIIVRLRADECGKCRGKHWCRSNSPTTKDDTLLAQGTKLVARLQYEVSSAAKVPVVAVIEYNYEQNGDLIIPAGTKAYGTLSQVTPQGWVTIKFDALEYPNGEQEKINGSSLSMEQGVLQGFG